METKKKIWLILMIAVSAISVIPLLRISFYNHPCADDFNYSILTYHAWQEKHSVWELLKAAWTTSADFWNSWQGLYASAFVLALQPSIFGETYYALTGVATIGVNYVCNLIFAEYVLHKKLHASRLEAAAFAFLASMLMVQWLPSAVEGIYWFNGAMNYTFFFGVMMLLVTGMISLHTFGRGGMAYLLKTIGTLALGIVLVGGNHVTAFMGILFGVGSCAMAAVLKKKKILLGNSVVLLGMLTGFFMNISSPGTANRQSCFENRPGFFGTVRMAISGGIHYIDVWIGLPVMICMVLMLPFVLSAVRRIRRETGYTFRYPLAVFIGSVAWICLMFCPPLYAMGVTGAQRLLNVVYFSFIWLMFVNEFYLCGWIDAKINLSGEAGREQGSITFPKSTILTGLILAIGLWLGCYGTSTAYKANVEIATGEARAYSDQAAERYETYLESSGGDVRVEGFWSKPELLYFDDITLDENDWRNISLRDYYELNSVALK